MKTTRKRIGNLEIVNRSDWPTAAVNILAKWAVDFIGGIDWKYTVLVKSCSRAYYQGRGGRFSQWVQVSRKFRRFTEGKATSLARLNRQRAKIVDLIDSRSRSERLAIIDGYIAKALARTDDQRVALWPYSTTYGNGGRLSFAHAPVQTFNQRVELLVGLIAHEATHATTGHPNKFMRGKRIDRRAMEFHCETRENEAVAAFRVAWANGLRERVLDAVRHDHIKTRGKMIIKKARRSDPSRKLDRAQSAFDRWSLKQKRAARALRKYARPIKYYSGKVAATKGGAS